MNEGWTRRRKTKRYAEFLKSQPRREEMVSKPIAALLGSVFCFPGKFPCNCCFSTRMAEEYLHGMKGVNESVAQPGSILAQMLRSCSRETARRSIPATV